MATSWVASAAATPLTRRIENGTSGLRDAQLVDKERGQDHGRAGEPGDRAPRAPADVRCLHQRVDEQQHAAGHEEGTEGIEVREPAAVTRSFLSRRNAPTKREHAEGDVDEQHPAPARSLREQAAEEDAGGAADPRDGCPYAEGGVAVTRAAKRARQRGEGRGRHHGRPDSLGKAGADEQRAGVRETSDQRRVANTTRPVTRMRRRPSRSAMRPPRSRKPP